MNTTICYLAPDINCQDCRTFRAVYNLMAHFGKAIAAIMHMYDSLTVTGEA